LDPAGVAKTDQVLVTLAISYLRNAEANALYSPDVQVTATNGGVATLITPTNKADTMTAIGNGKNSLVFGYNSSNKKKDVQIMLTGTKVGSTTWTITVGGVKKTITQVYKAK
jgi:predicted phage tail protein